MCFFRKRNDIRKCSKTHHYCVVGGKGGGKAAVVQMSSHPRDDGRLNVRMARNAEPGNPAPSYFMRRVRRVPRVSLSEEKKGWALSPSDRWFSRVLLRLHRRRKKARKK
jgi:hypothetical protein